MSHKDNPIEALNALPGTIAPMGALADAQEPGQEDAQSPTANALEEIDPMATPLWEIDKAFLNPFAEIPPEPTWCAMGKRPAIPKQGIITFSAKPKQGKSTSINALLIPILTGEVFDTITPADERPRLVITFDTEMDVPTLTKRYATMVKRLGKEANRLCVVPLLQTPKSKRRAMVDAITAKYNPDIVVIDQIARMVTNFNDAQECVEFGEWLAQYAAKRSVLCVIHQNKAADNTQMKGHLGSIMEELAVENYSVKRDNAIFSIIPTNARQSSVDESSACVTFAVVDGEIRTATDILEQQRKIEADAAREYFRPIFGEHRKLRHCEMVKRIMEQDGLKSPTAAKNKIARAIEAGAIVKDKSTPTDKNAPYIITAPNPYASAFDDLDFDEDDDL